MLKRKTPPKYSVSVIHQMMGGYRWFLYEDYTPIMESGPGVFDRPKAAMANWRKIKKTLGITLDVEEHL